MLGRMAQTTFESMLSGLPQSCREPQCLFRFVLNNGGWKTTGLTKGQRILVFWCLVDFNKLFLFQFKFLKFGFYLAYRATGLILTFSYTLCLGWSSSFTHSPHPSSFHLSKPGEPFPLPCQTRSITLCLPIITSFSSLTVPFLVSRPIHSTICLLASALSIGLHVSTSDCHFLSRQYATRFPLLEL